MCLVYYPCLSDLIFFGWDRMVVVGIEMGIGMGISNML